MTHDTCALYPERGSETLRGRSPAARPIPPHGALEPRPFPLRPVFEHLAQQGEVVHNWQTLSGVAILALRLGVDRRWVYRNLNRGLGGYVADAVAIRLGVHPVIIWPDWFTVDFEDDDELGLAA